MSKEKVKVSLKHRVRKALKQLENPLFLPKCLKFLYWPIYNFSWHNYLVLFENSLAKWSPALFGVGYIIFLNDFVTQKLGFQIVTSNFSSVLNLELVDKLQLLYFGIVLIFLGRLTYLVRRPLQIKKGPNLENWVAYGLSEFVYLDFRSLTGC